MSSFPYKLNKMDLESNKLTYYLQIILKAKKSLEKNVNPILSQLFQEYEVYSTSLKNQDLDVNYNNPMIFTSKTIYTLYMLLIDYSNHFWQEKFENTSKKVVVLPRCLTGPNFNLLKVKRTKIGWHKIIGTLDNNFNAWVLTQISYDHDFEVFITMGNRFKEPNFINIFRNLRKKYGNFGLIAVACIPELALGNTYVMEMGIPSHAVPLFYPGCAKWHGSNALKTEFPLNYILKLLLD
ncbi:MAG: hypothetical protein ACFFD7_15120 [Candidatus Thorarchaeota archaeon]